MSDSHLTYDELETPHEMHADCEAVESNLHLPRVLQTVPAQAAFVGARKKAARPVLVVSDAAAKLAGRLNPFD